MRDAVAEQCIGSLKCAYLLKGGKGQRTAQECCYPSETFASFSSLIKSHARLMKPSDSARWASCPSICRSWTRLLLCRQVLESKLCATVPRPLVFVPTYVMLLNPSHNLLVSGYSSSRHCLCSSQLLCRVGACSGSAASWRAAS